MPVRGEISNEIDIIETSQHVMKPSRHPIMVSAR